LKGWEGKEGEESGRAGQETLKTNFITKPWSIKPATARGRNERKKQVHTEQQGERGGGKIQRLGKKENAGCIQKRRKHYESAGTKEQPNG